MRRAILEKAGVHSTPDRCLGPTVEIFSIPGGNQAVTILLELLSNPGLEGSPVLLGPPTEIDYLRQSQPNERLIPRFMAEADEMRGLDAREIMRAGYQLELDRLRKFNVDNPGQAAPEILLTLLEQRIAHRSPMPQLDSDNWPTQTSGKFPLGCLFDPFEGQHHLEVLLAIIACPPTDVAAYLGFGGWNSCPPPSVHVALARLWREEYGARPIAVTHDTIEYFVSTPPATPLDAWRLAWEHHAYSEETYGTRGDIKSLAHVIWKRPHWAFWWD